MTCFSIVIFLSLGVYIPSISHKSSFIQLHRSVWSLIIQRYHLAPTIPHWHWIIVRWIHTRSLWIHSTQLVFVVCENDKEEYSDRGKSYAHLLIHPLCGFKQVCSGHVFFWIMMKWRFSVENLRNIICIKLQMI
jgi:hypothetical protein